MHVEVVDVMSSAVILHSLWVSLIAFSSIIVFLCASLGLGAYCCVCNITRPAYKVNLLFTHCQFS